MASLKLENRNVGAVTVRCQDKGGANVSSSFVVGSLPGVKPRSAAQVREVKLVGGKRAVTVTVGKPKTVQGGGVVTSFADPVRATPFPLGKKVPLPVSLFVKGGRRSRKADDVVYPLTFHDKTGEVVCETALPGTVVQVMASLEVGERTVAFNSLRKMLILGSGAAGARVGPDLSPSVRWSHPGGTFRPATKLDSTFTAGKRFTDPAVAPPPEILLALGYGGGQRIEAFGELRLTAPRSLDVDPEKTSFNRKRFSHTTDLLDANRGAFSLFSETVGYRLLDQYDARITDSVYGGVAPTIKENIHLVLRSRIPQVQAFIQTTLRATRDWREKEDGRIHDRLEAANIPKNTVRVVRPNGTNVFVFAPELLRTGGGGRPIGVLMEVQGGHVWSISVNSREDPGIKVDATSNSFSVRVVTIRNRKIRLRSDYSVQLT